MERRNKLLPGTKFKMKIVEREGWDHKKMARTYTVIKEYPHFVLAEYIVNGNRFKECFTRKEIEAGKR